MPIFAAITLFLSTAAFACPSLEGKYSNCHSINGGESTYTALAITQSDESDVTTFNMTYAETEGDALTNTYVADGKVITTFQWNPSRDASMSVDNLSICSEEGLHTNQFFFIGEVEVGRLETVYKKEGNALSVELTGSTMGMHVSDKVICE